MFDNARILGAAYLNDTELETFYNDSLEKIHALEAQIKEKLSNDVGAWTWSLELAIKSQKEHFGVLVFDYRSKSDATHCTRLETIYNTTVEKVSDLVSLIREKEATLVEQS